MKGIILAGGMGTRLYPSTLTMSKQLLPVYNKPMVYYPLSLLMLAGIREVLLISTPEMLSLFQVLLGDGSQLGVEIQYCAQSVPRGLADAFILGEDFIQRESVCLILGDNIFYGHGLSEKLEKAAQLQEGAHIFGYVVEDPHRYGIAEVSEDNQVLSLEEKPLHPKSNCAVTGLYFYDNQVVEIAKQLQPSARGELEITGVNQVYLTQKALTIEVLGRGFAWFDTGTHQSLLEAAQFIATLENRQGLQVACLEEIALNKGYIDENAFRQVMERMQKSEYGRYLYKVLKERGAV